MNLKDDFARFNLEEFQRASEKGEEYTTPWLDLDVEQYRAYREGEIDQLPAPFNSDPAKVLMLSHVKGMNVLCLAGGGGQQSAVYSLLGANVTVLDLTPVQLQADQEAAQHYHYAVHTIQGDMRDLSMLPDHHFDRVEQPVSTLFVPDLREVYAGVQRILRPGGLYYTDYTFPPLYMAEKMAWDGQGYLLRVTEPYRRGRLYETPDGKVNFSQGIFIGEFNHLLSDIINGLITEGLDICGVWESPRPDDALDLDTLTPGSEAHQACYLPFGISVVARKTQH